LGRLTGQRAKVRRYYLVAQPLDAKLPLPRRLGATLQTRLVSAGEPAAAAFPRPAAVIAERYAQSSTCIAAYHDTLFIGFIWLCTGVYEEDDVRCRYVLQQDDATAWDYDLYISPEFRNGIAFVKLWAAAIEQLRSRGRDWSLSRISAFSPDSRAAHRRMGAVDIGTAYFVDVLGVQLTLASVAPYVHLALPGGRGPALQLRAPAKRVSGEAAARR
jgi:hypothetical protein